MRIVTSARLCSIAAIVIASFASHVPSAQAQCCVVPDIGGTAQVPPPCPGGYQDGQAVRLNGLPPGIPVTGTLSVVNIHNVVEGPGGSLGGTTQSWDAIVVPLRCPARAIPR